MAAPAVLGANCTDRRFPSCRRRNLPYPDGLRHARIGEGVDDDGTDVAFAHLALEASGGRAVVEWLQPGHHVFGKAAPRVAAIVLPASAAFAGDVSDDGIVGMVVAARNRAFAPGNGGIVGVMVGNCSRHAGAAGSLAGCLSSCSTELADRSGAPVDDRPAHEQDRANRTPLEESRGPGLFWPCRARRGPLYQQPVGRSTSAPTASHCVPNL